MAGTADQLPMSWGSAVSRSVVAWLLVGLLLGPLLNLVYFLVPAIVGLALGQPFWTNTASGILLMTSVGGAAFALVIGIPVSAALDKFRRGPWSYALAGVLVSVVFFSAVALFGKGSAEEAVKSATLGAFFSAGYALLFWATLNFILNRDTSSQSPPRLPPARVGKPVDGGAAG